MNAYIIQTYRRMAESADPFRFLNMKKKRESNKQRDNSFIASKHEGRKSEASSVGIPNFSILNSLESQQTPRDKKNYDVHKYFNANVEAYLQSMRKLKIANAPLLAPLELESPIAACKEKVVAVTNETASMLTFAKQNGEATQLHSLESKLFNRPGLKKSGSFKMMEKMKGSLPHSQDDPVTSEQDRGKGVSPWELEENAEGQQLLECEICSRKFNPKSYEKHVRVCQKVFFKKRKPFNSRSGSLDSKNN